MPTLKIDALTGYGAELAARFPKTEVEGAEQTGEIQRLVLTGPYEDLLAVAVEHYSAAGYGGDEDPWVLAQIQ